MLAVDIGVVKSKIAICDEIAAEVRRTLTEKFSWTPTELEDDFDRLIFEALRVPIRGNIRGICRDPKEDMVLECAVNSNADLIVTGDRDLLVLQTYQRVRIITCRRYLSESSTALNHRPAVR